MCEAFFDLQIQFSKLEVINRHFICPFYLIEMCTNGA